MRSNRSDGFERDTDWLPALGSGADHDGGRKSRQAGIANPNSADEVFGEVGLVLVVVLGVVLAINTVLVALHIG
jgi:hypothetical protein